MKNLFTAEVENVGGRSGSFKSKHGVLQGALGNPLEQGSEKKGPNPEELFAAAYSSCFHGALKNAIKRAKAKVDNTVVTALVSLVENDQEGFELEIEICAKMPGLPRNEAEKILKDADLTCPYSKLVRGESKHKLTLED
ncbi:MAG: Ohr family peroxiredoxin [Verrucomicrobiales bacterium]